MCVFAEKKAHSSRDRTELIGLERCVAEAVPGLRLKLSDIEAPRPTLRTDLFEGTC